MVRKWLGVIILSMGLIGLKFIVKHQNNNVDDSTLSIEKKWSETGFALKDIRSLFASKQCYMTKKYFLSCMNGLSRIAEKQGLEITETGRLIQGSTQKNLTEREKMIVWDQVYETNQFLSIPIDFLWVQLSKEASKDKKSEAWVAAQAFNAYISVFKDPHSYILPKDYFDKVVAQSQNRMNSYGFIVNRINGRYLFTRIYPESVFDRAGIKRGDILLEVDGTEVTNLSNDELMELFKGKDQNKFLISQKEKIVNLDLNKKNQTLKSVQYKTLKTGDQKLQVQISIYKIADGVCQETEEALAKATKAKASGVILDLRDDSGGSMDEVLCLAGLFIGEKKVYSLNFFNQPKSEPFYGANQQVYFGPLAVLINKGTASSA
ncbi:MAG: PDZ domain-containing protein, partial [Bdellovibrionales bacterium]|nr:PDZ domain-containing protein [Bdellovibrionales bacterium]